MVALFLIIICVLLVGFGAAFWFMYRYYERQLKRETKRAQKSELLKTVFLDNISRALRTPVKAILGYSNLILEERDDQMQPAQVREIATRINKSTQDVLSFIGHLLELSKFEGITPAFTFIEVNLSELFASYRREAQTVAKKDTSVRVRTDLSPHCRGRLDTNFMHQLMMHLLTNAANHIAQGDITIYYTNERKGLKVVISYMGNGQAEVIGEDIYSFLQREDALNLTNESSGLELSLCRAIVDALDGELDINSDTGRKTNATFWLPCKMVNIHKNM
jgi:K+-sensing histidine kinase KdpD